VPLSLTVCLCLSLPHPHPLSSLISPLSVTAAELSSQNKSSLDHLTQQLHLYAHTSHVQQQIDNILQTYDTAIASIHETYTPFHLTQALQRSTADYLSSIQRLEGNLSMKLDRSEIHHLDYLYQELEGYQTKMTRLESGYQTLLKELEIFTMKTTVSSKEMREEVERHMRRIEKEFKMTDERILRHFTQTQQEVHSLEIHVKETYTPMSEHQQVIALCVCLSVSPSLSVSLCLSLSLSVSLSLSLSLRLSLSVSLSVCLSLSAISLFSSNV
jgi:archaellum component FlaC